MNIKREFMSELLSDENTNLYQRLLNKFDVEVVNCALELTDGNRFQAAKMLGINRLTLRTKMKVPGVASKIPLDKRILNVLPAQLGIISRNLKEDKIVVAIALDSLIKSGKVEAIKEARRRQKTFVKVRRKP